MGGVSVTIVDKDIEAVSGLRERLGGKDSGTGQVPNLLAIVLSGVPNVRLLVENKCKNKYLLRSAGTALLFSMIPKNSGSN